MLRTVGVVYKTVFANQCAAVRPTEGVECRLTLDVDVAEYSVDAGNNPANGVLLRNYLNFGMLGVRFTFLSAISTSYWLMSTL